MVKRLDQHLPDFSGGKALEDSQRALRELARRTKMIEPSGVLAEIEERKGTNHD